MTRISVDIAQVSATAGRAQAFRRGVQERGHRVSAVLHGLDLQISARGHFDARLRTLVTRLGSQDVTLGEHARFLDAAAGRYEMAERSLLDASTRPRQVGASRSFLEAVFGNASQRRQLVESLLDLAHATPWLGATISFAEALVAREGRGLDWVVGEVARRQFDSLESFSAAVDHLDGYFESRGGFWRLGNAALDLGLEFTPVGLADTVSSVAAGLREGDLATAVWEALPGKGALEGGMHIGDVIAQDMGVAEWAADFVPGMDGWAPDFSGLSTPEVLGTVELDFTESVSAGLDAVWDWVSA